MTTLEKIRAEIKKRYDDCEEDWETGEQYGYWNCLKIIDKYAEQEPSAESGLTDEMMEHYKKLAEHYNGGAHEPIQDTDVGD